MTTIAPPLPAADTGLTEHIAALQRALQARLDELLPANGNVTCWLPPCAKAPWPRASACDR